MSGNLFLRSTSSFDYYCGTNKSIFFGLQRLLKTQFFLGKKANFPLKKLLDQYFPFYRAWQNSRKKLKGSKRYSGIDCGSNKIISSGPKCCWKHKFSRKKADFPRKKGFWLIFPVLWNMTIIGKLFSRSTSSFDYYWGTYKGIFFGLEMLLKTQFLKKRATLPVKKNIWPVLTRIIVCDKPQGTSYKGPQAISTNTVYIKGNVF